VITREFHLFRCNSQKENLIGFQVELSSGKEVADIIPNIHEIEKCSGRGVIVTGPAPAGSGFDFFTRFFCPKFGVDEVMSYSFSKYTLEEWRS
jgi:predicted PhzF superfamily epimerase YddE/YHI9